MKTPNPLEVHATTIADARIRVDHASSAPMDRCVTDLAQEVQALQDQRRAMITLLREAHAVGQDSPECRSSARRIGIFLHGVEG
jgi:hypothetical protein